MRFFVIIKEKLDYKSMPQPITFLPTDTVQRALDVMCEKNIGSIVVVDEAKHVVGIVTERDMMRRVLGAKLNPSEVNLESIMTKDVRIANENDELMDWLQTMSSERFRHLPVVNQKDELVALLSQGDFVAYTWPALYDQVRRDIKGKIEHTFPILLIVFAMLTLILIAFNF